jgi:hypothetical protein
MSTDKLTEALQELAVYAGSCAEGPTDPEFSQFLHIEAKLRKLAALSSFPLSVPASGVESRSCTCHSDDAPEVCQKKYAATECQALSSPTPSESEPQGKALPSEDEIIAAIMKVQIGVNRHLSRENARCLAKSIIALKQAEAGE